MTKMVKKDKNLMIYKGLCQLNPNLNLKSRNNLI